MTTDENGNGPTGTQNLEKLEANLSRVEDLTQRLLTTMSQKREARQSLQGPAPELYAKAAGAYWTEAINNPGKIFEQQIAFWGKSVKHFVEAQHLLAQGKLEAPTDPTPPDRRFANPLWDTHPYFNFAKQQYLLNAAAIHEATAAVEGLDDKERKRLEFFSSQIVDMLSPTNFLGTNPDALTRAVETEGQSLIDGLENLVADLEANNGDLVVTLADRKAFEIGKNLATTPGEVVFRNHLFELIQYAPATETVHTTPLLIFPPWINKFYILDLKEQNSLIKWIVDQGYTLFVVSWVNPGSAYRDIGIADYIEDGFLRAMTEVKAICNVKKINVVGYCIAGTTLSLTLALMDRRGDKSVNAATLLTALTDFADPGEVGVFLNDDFLDGIAAEVAETGVMRSYFMSRTFSFLRSNDLVYGPAIKSYMMGQTPPAFDLLYWNGDGANLPGKMVVEYLRGLCQNNEFAGQGFSVAGEKVQIGDVKVPIFAVACETDHIANWPACYAGVQQMGSAEKNFVLSGSGHIAGIVNPPAKKKYGHWMNPDMGLADTDWLATADRHDGSWWPTWERWLHGKSGKMIPARKPGDADHPSLGAAPGTYVTARPDT